MEKAKRIIISLVLAVIASTGAWGGTPEPTLGHIYYTQGANDGGTLEFYKYSNCEDGQITFTNGVSGTLHVEELEPVNGGGGYVIYVKAVPDVVHNLPSSVEDIKVILGTSAQYSESRRQTDPTIPINVTINVDPADNTTSGCYCFILPDNGNDVIVSATFADKPCQFGVNFLDSDGEVKATDENTPVYLLDGNETVLGVSNKQTWYIADSNLAFENTPVLKGDVHLILADNSVTTAPLGIDGEGNNLTIYAQSMTKEYDDNDHVGILYATYQDDGIISNFSTLTINGGDIAVEKMYSNGDITINGGQVNVNGEMKTTSDDAKIYLSWMSAEDYVRVSKYIGKVNIVKRFVGSIGWPTEDSIFSTGDVDNNDAINGYWLEPIDGYLVGIPSGQGMYCIDAKDDGFTIDGTTYYIYDAYDPVIIRVGDGKYVAEITYPDAIKNNNARLNEDYNEVNFDIPAEDIVFTSTMITVGEFPTLFAEDAENVWMTWCDYNNWELPTDGSLTAYEVTNVSGSTVTVTAAPVTGNEPVVIPAYMPVLIKRNVDVVDGRFAFEVYRGVGEWEDYSDPNATFKFIGNANSDMKTDNVYPLNGNSHAWQTYILKDDHFIYLTSGGSGISRNRCWLNLKTGKVEDTISSRLNIVIDDNATTAISQISPDNADANSIRNLSGQRVNANYRGIVIKGNKKVINK